MVRGDFYRGYTRTELNLIMLTLATIVCASFYISAFLKAWAIDTQFPGDSRAGIAMIPCSPAWVMSILLLLRIMRVVLAAEGASLTMPVRLFATIASSLVAIGLVSVTIYLPVVVFSAFLFWPGTLVGSAAALFSFRNDIE